MSQTECGVACLAMLMSYHGRDTTLAEARELLGTGRDGVGLEDVIRAAAAQGMRVQVRRSPILPEVIREPILSYQKRHHLVVVEQLRGARAVIADPIGGRLHLRRAHLEEDFGGILLRLTPGPGFVRRGRPWRSDPVIRYVQTLVETYRDRRLLGVAVLLSAALTILGLVLPLLTARVVDEVTATGHILGWTAFVAAALAATAATALITWARAMVLLRLRVGVDDMLAQRVVGHLLRLPLAYFAHRGRGDLIMRLAGIASTREVLTNQLLTLAIDTVLVLGLGAALVAIAPGYAAILFPLMALELLLMVGVQQMMAVRNQRELVLRSREQTSLVEIVQGIVAIKANGAEGHSKRRWLRDFAAYQEAMAHRSSGSALTSGLQAALTALQPMVALLIGAVLVTRGDLTIGQMLGANVAATVVVRPIATFAGTGDLYFQLRAQVERLLDILDTPVESMQGRTLPPGVTHDILVEGLTFAYDGQAPILHDIDLRVPAGAKVGIVGRTGSGKSTLGQILLGLYRPTAGRVLHGGVDLTELDLNRLRSTSGAVLQDISLLNGSIRDNITLSHPEATDADVTRAARIAGLYDDVMRLPLKFDTVVGEGGTSISAGQRQRIALARAVVHHPRFLLLDEATSHLDPATERIVDAALSALNVTRVVISHRPSIVADADHVIVLDHGRIVESGDPRQLATDPNGAFAQLFGNSGGARPDS